MDESKTVEALVSVGARYVGRAPTFTVEPGWWSEVEAVTSHLDELLGVPTVVLRLVATDRPAPMRGGQVTYHVQALAEPRAGVLDPTSYPHWSDVVAPEPLRASWAEVDGPTRLIEWAQSVVGPEQPTQVKTWNLSCLLRFSQSWAKASSRFCALDAAVIQHVQQYDASLTPTVLATSAENRWSLLAHAAGIDCWEPDQAIVEDVVPRWVAVQAAGANGLDVPRLLPEDLPGEVERLLQSVELPDAEQLLDALPAVIDELESAGLPITLVHGDFHPGNWRSSGKIVDWADTFIGHPATDLKRLHDFLPPGKRPHVAAVWESAWRRHVPGSDPLRALRPMAVLGPLTYALMYQRFLDNIEPDEQIYHRTDPYTCLQAALRATRSGPEDPGDVTG